MARNRHHERFGADERRGRAGGRYEDQRYGPQRSHGAEEFSSRSAGARSNYRPSEGYGSDEGWYGYGSDMPEEARQTFSRGYGENWPTSGGGRFSAGSSWEERGGREFSDERPYGARSSRYQQPSRQQQGGWWSEPRSMWDRTSDEVASWFGDDEAARRRELDQYRGRRPKNYTRSDDRIREDVCDRLSNTGSIDPSDVEVAVKNGEVVLSGTVANRHERRFAEDCADDISGVTHVQNNLRIKQQEAGSSTGAASNLGSRSDRS